jgi:hypothetical protein
MSNGGVRYTLVDTSSTNVPVVAAAVHSAGMNIPGGAIDEVIVRFAFTLNAAGNIAADTSNIIDSFRLILNGETVWDYQAQISDNANNGAGTFGYLLNSLGPGRSVDVNTGTAVREYYIRVPIGRNAPPGISRLEYSLGYAALTGAGGAPTAASTEFWIRYNPAMSTTVTLGAATTAPYTASTQQIVTRVPQNVPGTLAGVLIQTDQDAADEITDIRVVSQSDFAMDVDMWRLLNGNLSGIYFMDPATANGLQMGQALLGQIFVPLYQLSLADDLRMQVTANAAGTLSVTPLMTSPIAGKAAPAQVQTEAVPTNIAKSVLATSSAQN